MARSDNPGLTGAEKDVQDKLVAAWNAFISLPGTMSRDRIMFADAIDRCATIIGCQVAYRTDPERWAEPQGEKP